MNDLTTYRVTVKVDGTYPDDPYFAGRDRGPGNPDFTCEVQAVSLAEAETLGYVCHPATTKAMHLYPYRLAGQFVKYEITEVK